MKRFILTTIGIALLAAGLMNCKEDSAVQQEKPYNGPLEEINDVRVLYSEAGMLKVKMETPLQLKYESNDRVYPKEVNIDFYGPNNTVITTLRADSGRYIQSQNFYKVMGHVVVINKEKNQELYTPELNWNPNTKKVYTDKPVKILSKNTGERLEGIGLDTDEKFSNYTIRNPTGVFHVNAVN